MIQVLNVVYRKNVKFPVKQTCHFPKVELCVILPMTHAVSCQYILNIEKRTATMQLFIVVALTDRSLLSPGTISRELFKNKAIKVN